MSDNTISQTIKAALENIRSMADSNTIVGEPIETANGTIIIPVTKLFLGFVTGGIDYLSKKAPQANKDSNNFGGGGGTGLTVTPVAFLVITPDGKVEMLNINQPAGPTDPISGIIGLIERSPELIERFKELFGKNNGDSEKDE